MPTLITPPSKSHTMRALLFSLMSTGTSYIRNYLHSPDTDAMITAISSFGAKVHRTEETLIIEGTGGNLSPSFPIDAGNSGQVLRFIGALAALSPFPTILTGDESLCTNRPIAPLLEALEQLGASTRYLGKKGFAPFEICGPIKPGKATLPGIDSQPISGLLMAASFLPTPSEVFVENPHEQPWIELTLSWLKHFDISIDHRNYRHYKIPGGLEIKGFEATIPGDFGSAAFPIAAAIVTGRPITLSNLPRGDPQGDKKLIDLLSKMGILIHWEQDRVSIEGGRLGGATIDVNSFVDAVPILATLACFASSPTTLINALPARFKESDRLKVMELELSKMGARIESTHDSLTIHPSTLYGASLDSHRDHRVAMALAVAALGAKGSSEIHDTACISKSYSRFQEHLQQAGHDISSPSPQILRIYGK